MLVSMRKEFYGFRYLEVGVREPLNNLEISRDNKRCARGSNIQVIDLARKGQA